MKRFLIFILAIVINIIVFFSVAYCGVLILDKQDEEIWNNGICSYCQEGKWEFHGQSATRRGYLYTCNNCHAIIELNFQQEK